MPLGSDKSRSPEIDRFGVYLRYGVVLPENGELKFNPYRAEDGRYDFAPGHGTLSPRAHSGGTIAATAMAERSQVGGSAWRGPKRPYPPRVPRSPVVRNRPAGLSDSMIASAQAAQRRYGVPASITIAQLGLESAWGKHMSPGSNNPFGIKARPGEPFVTVDTLEQDRNGRVYRITAKFRKFRSLDEAFDAHAQLLAGPRYAHARSGRNAEEFAYALTGVYATDQQYGAKLKTLMRRHGLEALDSP